MKKTPIPDLLKQAESMMSSAPSNAASIYREVVVREPGNLVAHNALEHLRDRDSYGRWMHINCMIHPADDIFRFFAGHAKSSGPVREYLSDGWRTLSELMLLLESVDRPLAKMAHVLEFAAGFGRFTRHLSRAIPQRVTCTDIQPGSVEFLRTEFAVEGFYSDVDPAKIAFPRQYDLIFVLSLFTHLPPDAWVLWLKTLHHALLPGGLLVISVHNEIAAKEAGVVFDERGVAFIRSSESPSISPDDYGTTFTTDSFLHATVQSALGEKLLRHEPLRFWGGQDAVVIAR